MPCVSMFSRFKAGGSSHNLLEGNPITTYFEIGRQTATAGPGFLWKVHDAYRKSDGKVRFILASMSSMIVGLAISRLVSTCLVSLLQTLSHC